MRNETDFPESPLRVSFVTFDLGEGSPDLIAAFAIAHEHDPMGVDNLILLRTPQYEVFMPPEERGVSVSFDRGGKDDKAERSYLRKITLSDGEVCVGTGTELSAQDHTLRRRGLCWDRHGAVPLGSIESG